MIGIIFEVTPHPDHVSDYMEIAASLKPELEQMGGFISIERFESLVVPGKILSLSFWRDEGAVQNWRRREAHRHAQEKGRNALFKEYRLRVVSVLRDYGMEDRDQVPEDSKDYHTV